MQHNLPHNPANNLRILSVTGGHRVDLDAFTSMMSATADELSARWAHAFQPAAQRWLCADAPFDAIVLHDLPGVALRRGSPPTPFAPTTSVQQDLIDLTNRGVGLVVLHHALAGWPTWDGWADALGARFSYAPSTLHGKALPSSGTQRQAFTIHVEADAHPVCAGVESFEVHDEPYLCWIDETRVVPLLRSDVDMDGGRFVSSFEHVLVGEELAPRCDAFLGASVTGSNLVGWANAVGASPIVVLQPGDSGDTFRHPTYRQLLRNAVQWVASDEARTWAIARDNQLMTTDGPVAR
jgi:uncharacterized protein